MNSGKNELDPDTRSAAILMQALNQLSTRWSLSKDEMSVLLGLRAFAELESIGELPLRDLPPLLIRRAAALLKIFELINILLPIPRRADAWIRKPNRAPGFDGRSALQVMINGGVDGLEFVRDFLLGQCAELINNGGRS